MRNRKLLILYLTVWVAILPPVGLIFGVGYLVTEWYPQPMWVQIVALIVTVHLAIGWVWFATDKGYDFMNGKDETN